MVGVLEINTLILPDLEKIQTLEYSKAGKHQCKLRYWINLKEKIIHKNSSTKNIELDPCLYITCPAPRSARTSLFPSTSCTHRLCSPLILVYFFHSEENQDLRFVSSSK